MASNFLLLYYVERNSIAYEKLFISECIEDYRCIQQLWFNFRTLFCAI